MAQFTFLFISAILIQTVFSQCLSAPQAYPNSCGCNSGLNGFAGNGLGYGASNIGYGPANIGFGQANIGYGGNIGYGNAGFANTGYGGIGIGEFAAVGELPIAGPAFIDGSVPVCGNVQFNGNVPAGGLVTIAGNTPSICGCNNAVGPVYGPAYGQSYSPCGCF